MRVTVNGERAEIATNRRFDIKRWSNGKPIGSSKEAKRVSSVLRPTSVLGLPMIKVPAGMFVICRLKMPLGGVAMVVNIMLS